MRLSATTVVFLFAGVIDVAHAQSNLGFATQRFDEGVRQYESKDFEAALQSFRASYSLYASPNTRLYVARSMRELGRVVEAVEEFALAEREALDRQRQDPRYRQAAEAARDERRQLEPQLGAVQLLFSSTPGPDVEISVSGRAVPPAVASLPIKVLSGPVHLSVKRGQETLLKKDVHVASQELLDVHVSLPERLAPARVHAASSDGALADESGSGTSELAGGILIGAGIAVGIGAGILFALTADKHAEVSACDADPDCLNSSRRDDIASTGEAYQVLAYVSGGVALASIATGVILLLLDEEQPDPKSTSSVAITLLQEGALLGLAGSF